MKSSTAMGRAWRAYTASFGGTMKFLLTETCLTLICLAPLLFLTNGRLAAGALLCVPLWLLMMLPARMNAARDMAAALAGEGLGSPRLIEGADYGKKLLCGLKRAGFLLLWAVPLIALAVIFRNHFAGEVDGLTVYRMIRNDLGGGDQIRGIRVLVLITVGTLLVLMFGCAFHSGARQAWAQGDPRRVRGHHGKVVLAWLASLVTVLPMVLAIVAAVARYLPVLRDLNGLLMGTVSLPATRGTLLILAAGALLTLPLLPLRSLIPAALVSGLGEDGRKA